VVVRRGAPAIQGVSVGQAASAKLALAVLLGMAIATTGCQTAPDGEAVESLQVRAQKYLELKQKRDWVAIYDGLLDPELHPKLKREAFLRRRDAAFDVLGFTVVSTKEEGGTGKVVVKVDAMIPVLNPRGGTTMLRKELEEPQDWVARDGRWYIQLES
jgi:hypothetical protein